MLAFVLSCYTLTLMSGVHKNKNNKENRTLSNIFMRTVLTAAVFRIDTYKIWRL